MRRGRKTNAGHAVLKLRQTEVQTARGKSLAPLSSGEQVLADVAPGTLQSLSGAGRRWTASGRSTASRNVTPADEDALTRAIVALASEYGGGRNRRVTAPLQAAGWHVGKDRVHPSRTSG